MEDEFMDEIEVLNCFTSEILNLKKKKLNLQFNTKI